MIGAGPLRRLIKDVRTRAQIRYRISRGSENKYGVELWTLFCSMARSMLTILDCGNAGDQWIRNVE